MVIFFFYKSYIHVLNKFQDKKVLLPCTLNINALSSKNLVTSLTRYNREGFDLPTQDEHIV